MVALFIPRVLPTHPLTPPTHSPLTPVTAGSCRMVAAVHAGQAHRVGPRRQEKGISLYWTGFENKLGFLSKLLFLSFLPFFKISFQRFLLFFCISLSCGLVSHNRAANLCFKTVLFSPLYISLFFAHVFLSRTS